jgi:hypothetical protein
MQTLLSLNGVLTLAPRRGLGVLALLDWLDARPDTSPQTWVKQTLLFRPA